MKLAKILSTPDKWGQGHFGVNEAGELASGPRAARYCFNGALNLLLNEHYYYGTGHPWSEAERRRALDIFDAVTGDGAGLGMISWNDQPERTFGEVHAVASEWDRLWALDEDWRLGLADRTLRAPSLSWPQRIVRMLLLTCSKSARR